MWTSPHGSTATTRPRGPSVVSLRASTSSRWIGPRWSCASVRFRNLLVQRYAEVDDVLAIGHLSEVEPLRRFVAAMVTLADQP